MDFDLRLTSGEDCDKGEVEPIAIDNMLGVEEKMHDDDDGGDDDDGDDDDAENGNMVAEIHDDLCSENGRTMISHTDEMVEYKIDSNLEPLSGMEFSSHGEAYSFYQEYARSVGFNTAIQNSRRSKTSREFIDAKFACSRYGTKREYDKKFPRPQYKQGNNKQDSENATSRRSCVKTDCKASMHVKRRSDGKWIIHNFVKEHNHELLPAQAICEKTRQIYAAMARQFAEYKNVFDVKCDPKSPFDKPRNLALETSDARSLLDFLTQMQIANPNFFYALDLSDDLRMKNLFWVDAKSRYDYVNFSDVVSFDTTYIRTKYKIPLAVFVGVNHHYQFMLLGCAFLSDEGAHTYSWLMQTWLKAMGGVAPKVMISDHCQILKSVIPEIFPNSYHCFCLWHIWGKVTDVIKCNENFVSELERCIYGSWTADDFENRWQVILDRFQLRDYEWIHGLYEDRRHWVPTFTRGIFLGGMSTSQRSESVNSYLDKYVHKRTTVQEFLRQYEMILQDRYEEEARADFDTWNKQPVLKSPSPLEKHVANLYTNPVFKKFQVEVLGAVACHPKQEAQDDEMLVRFNVQDFEKNQHFLVSWNALKSEIFCMCCLFEYKGLICRHAMIVLQVCGLGEIPFQYILSRWTKEAKVRRLLGESSEQTQTRVQRYNELCHRAMRLGEEGSRSRESFAIVVRALDEAFGNCVNLNNSCNNLLDVGTPASLSVEEDVQSRSMSKMIKKKNPPKRKKVTPEAETAAVSVQDNLQQMDKLGPRTVTIDSYYGGQQSVQGMVQLNLMAPTRDSYYGGQHTIQGLGQLNSIAPCHDGYYGTPQSMHGLGQMDFFRTSGGFTYSLRDEANARHAAPLHDDSSRHA